VTQPDDTPLYKFKDNVGYVLAKTDTGLTIIEVGMCHFVIVGLTIHPDSNQPTYMGQIASGIWDGTYWYLEPGWLDKIDTWATVV
jgi:hypothetical protein